MDVLHTQISGSPAVVQAGWYRFAPGERILHALVVSSAWVWVVRGSGQIRSAGRTFVVGPRQLVQLPWRHEVHYLADERDPFHVGAIHLLPWHEAGVPIVRRAAHGRNDELGDDPTRTPTFVGVQPEPTLHSAAGYAIELGTLAVGLMSTGGASDEELRAIGKLALAERGRLSAGDDHSGIPATLRLMQEFVHSHLDGDLTVEVISGEAGCSPATAERLFARHVGISLQRWVRSVRMDAAAMLLRTTGLRVNEVGREVGFTDPLYFSRVFTKTYGVSPRSFVHRQIKP